MIKNLLNTTLRHFRKNLLNTLTIILSLAIALGVVNLLTTFLIYELNTDSYHKNGNQLYRLVSEDPFGDRGRISYIKRDVLQYLSEHYPGIESSSLVYTFRNNGISIAGKNEKLTKFIVLATDSPLVSMFDFPALEGSSEFKKGGRQIILTKEASRRLFGEAEALDKRVEIHTNEQVLSFIVSAILDKNKFNSHLQFDALIFDGEAGLLTGGIGYLQLYPGASAKELEQKINADKNSPDLMGKGNIDYFLQPLREIYFDKMNTRTFSKARNKLFIWVSWTVIVLLMVIAGFNFLNLFIISYLKRWREFGLKKILGAPGAMFRATAVFEVLFYLIIAYLISLVISRFFLPYFRNLIETSFDIKNYLNGWVLLVTLVSITLIALLVIMQSMRIIGRIRPVDFIVNKAGIKVKFNRILIGMQFFISIVLISGSIAMIRQVNYIQEKPLGINRNIFEIRCPSNAKNLDGIKNSMLTIPGVEKASICSGNPVSDNIIARYDLESGDYYTPYLYFGDEDLIETLGLTLIEGEIPSTTNKEARLVNETFIRYFQMDDPLGKKIPGTEDQYIYGIVQDFNIGSLKIEVPPAIISLNDRGGIIIAKIDNEKLNRIVTSARDIWLENFPDHPFNYLLLEDELRKKHQEDIVFGKIILSSSIISILITAFGIFALSWGYAVDKSKEMGIRKVIGASSWQLFVFQLKPMLIYAVTALLISIPVSYFLVMKWLEVFAYRIPISPDIFMLTFFILIMIILLTTGYQTARASKVNPVDVLKYE